LAFTGATVMSLLALGVLLILLGVATIWLAERRGAPGLRL